MKKTIRNYPIYGIYIIIILIAGSLLSTSTFGLNWPSNVSIKTSNIGKNSINSNKSNNNTKAVIIAFDDAWKSQFTYAKPILDKYGFKGSFFVVCNYVEKNPDRMTWNDVQTLEKQGHDIESHTMNHIPLDALSQQELNYEIGQSKQCIIDHGIEGNNNNVPIFAYPYDTGRNNITVINTVAKYYLLGRTGDRPLAFMNCNLALEKNNGSINQLNYINGNCSSTPAYTSANNNYNNNNNNIDSKTNMGKATFYDKLSNLNKYSIGSWTHHPHYRDRSYKSSQMFDEFVQEVSSQDKYNHNGMINTIPIITYHNFTNDPIVNYVRNKYTTDTNLFSMEMKYLYDNHFIVLPISAIRYDENNNYLYINGFKR